MAAALEFISVSKLINWRLLNLFLVLLLFNEMWVWCHFKLRGLRIHFNNIGVVFFLILERQFLYSPLVFPNMINV